MLKGMYDSETGRYFDFPATPTRTVILFKEIPVEEVNDYKDPDAFLSVFPDQEKIADALRLLM